MAKYNPAISVTFNDNDGGVGWQCNPEVASDIARHNKIFGKWRTRWILLKRFWEGLRWMEDYTQKYYHEMDDAKLWVFKPEIPE